MRNSTIDRVRRFWAGQGRCVASMTPGGRLRPRQDLTDAEWLATWRRGLAEQAHWPGLNVPSIFPDFGTVSVPRHWGGAVTYAADSGNPYIQPVAQTVAEALAVRPRPVHDSGMDAARAVRLYQALGADAWFRTPDMQGTLNTAGMVVQQEELLMGMVSEPELVRTFLDQVSDFILELWQWQRRECGDRLCGNIWPYTFFPADLGISLTEDLMPLLSPALYAEFGIPVLQKINRVAGGLQIHCCGEWGRHAPALAAAGLRLRAIEFHFPFTKIEELAPLADGTVFVPYIALDKQTRFRSLVEYWRWLLNETDDRHRFWFASCEDTPEQREFVTEIDSLTTGK